MAIAKWQTLLLEREDGKEVIFLCTKQYASEEQICRVVQSTCRPGIMANMVSDNKIEIIQFIYSHGNVLVLEPIILGIELSDDPSLPYHVFVKDPETANWQLDNDKWTLITSTVFVEWKNWRKGSNN